LRLNADGKVDTGFTVDTGFDTIVNTIAPAVDGSGDVFVGRGFTGNNCALASCIVRLHADGTVNASFAIGTGFNGTVFTIVPANDGSGDVYVGGEFTTYNGAAANRIARLNANGTLDAGFAIGTGFNGTVRAMALANDGSGDVYVGGLFTAYNGTGANRVVRLNADGTRDAGFATGSAFDGDVYAIAPAVDGSGDVYIGGLFTTYNGVDAHEIVRLHANGGNAGAISFGFNDNVLAIAPAGDGSGDVYVGGFFTTYNLAAANHIVRLNANGTVDAGFATGTAFTGIFPPGVFAIAPANDGSGDVFAGGFFSVYKTTTADQMVRLSSGGTVR
jgi:hypothetical protein